MSEYRETALGGTSYWSMSIDQLWSLVENHPTPEYASVMAAWSDSSTMLDEHARKVKGYIEKISEAWPPEKSAAANAYNEQLNDLLNHLSQTSTIILNNRSAFKLATQAISDYKEIIRQAKKQYDQNQILLDKFKAEQAAQTAPSAAQPSVGSSSQQPASSPVASGTQEGLVETARRAMGSMISELSQAHVQMAPPPRYKPPFTAEDDSKPVSTQFPPVAMTNVGFGSGYETTSSSSSTSSSLNTRHTEVASSHAGHSPDTPHASTTAAAAPSSTATPRQPGLILGGTPTSPALTPTAISPGLTPIGPSASPTTVLPPGLVGPSETFAPRGSRTPIGRGPSESTGINGRPTTSRSNGEGLGRSGGRPTLPNGVIGTTPPSATGRPLGSRTTQRVGPPGGVIEPSRVSSAPASSRSITRSTPAHSSGPMQADKPRGLSTSSGSPLRNVRGRAGHRRDADDVKQWDPDNPWETAEGVDPVLLPPEEQRIDPGPAIGLR